MRKALLLMLLALLVAVPATAQEETLPEWIEHTACEVDLTGETVTIYHVGDISGPFAPITQPLLAGLADAMAYYNARGGICGVTIAADNRDTAGDPAQTQAAYDFYSTLEDKPDVLVLYSSADSELLRTQLAEDEIPVLISAGSVAGLYGETGDDPGWIYASNPLYVDQFGSFCDYVAANAEQFPEPVIGYISWPGPFGGAAFQPETIAYCEGLGIDVLDTPEFFLPTATDISTNVQNLVDAGATILYTNTLATGTVAVARTVVDLGLENDVQLAGVNWSMDTSVGLLSRTSLRENGLPAVDGIIGSVPFRWYSETDHPGIALISEQHAANERGLTVQNVSYLLGFALVDTYVELYTQAVNQAGSLDAVDGALLNTVIQGADFRPLDLYQFAYPEGMRSTSENRIAMMKFLNATGDGVATSGEDAMTVDPGDGTALFIPVIVPLTEFAPAPDLRPGQGEE